MASSAAINPEDVFRPAYPGVPDAVQFQLLCPRCGAAEIERGKPGDGAEPGSPDLTEGATVHADGDNAYSPIGTRGGHVSVDMYCAAGHAFQLVIANHKGAEYVAVVS